MKTDAIQLAIRSSKTGVEDRQAADDQLSAMATALAAKDVEIAAMREALKPFSEIALSVLGSGASILGGNPKVFRMHDKYLDGGKDRFLRPSDFAAAKAAISPSTSKVLVDIEEVITVIQNNTPGEGCTGCLTRIFGALHALSEEATHD